MANNFINKILDVFGMGDDIIIVMRMNHLMKKMGR
jgi:hypothetical protein